MAIRSGPSDSQRVTFTELGTIGQTAGTRIVWRKWTGAIRRFSFDRTAGLSELLSSDGKALAYQSLHTNRDFGSSSPAATLASAPSSQTPAEERAPVFSPDGNGLLTCPTNRAPTKIYVMPFQGERR